ncbi:retrovirus-related pol polyprotein from transposon TNT 1-94 [Tanacetum coccineum]
MQTRRQLAIDPEMCMFALTVSIVELKNIKEAMANSAWIEAMQEELHQFDRQQEVYVAQPDGFVDPDHPNKVYHLRNALYGLKQAPRAWDDILLVQIYVDDIIFGSTNPKFSKRFEKLMHGRFEMSLMGEMKLFLGLQIHQSPRGIFINQAKHTLEILKKHGMKKGQIFGTPMATKPKLDADLSGEPVDQTNYRSKIGSLMYLASSRPDIVQAVPFTWDSGDKLVSWMLKKQDCTAMSSAEAEYVALSASCAQVMWMRTQLQDYSFNYNKIPLYCDSQSAIAISCNPVQHSRTKHIHTRRPYALSWKPCQGDSLNLPDHRIHKDGDGDASFQLKSDSLPHAHAQSTKTFYKHQDSRIMKAQELKTKTSANSDIKDNSSEIKLRGRLLASFQDDAKYEHVGQDTRSQGGKDDQDKQGKDLKISDIKTKSKDNDKGSRSKITKHEGTSLQRIQRPRPQDLNDKSNLIDLMKECHNELTSGEIVSLKILSRTRKFVHYIRSRSLN